ncbi:MAG: hypothetical protein EA425_06400 [Puniceicoccaceae bacterium]|nr:MAG: hypothetical protein EA425_06400 [Puniceicoccaceae bacterium]
MRFQPTAILTAALLFVLGPLATALDNPSTPAGVNLVRLWTEYREAASFVRLSEYFTGRENPSGAVLLRSQPEVRDGFYFSLRLRSTQGRLPGGEIILEVLPGETAETPRRLTFPFEPPGRRSALFHVGLTGDDWPDPQAHPVAWRLQVHASDGRLLAAEQSLLWETETP